jgi:hypothetical protein
MYEVIIKQQGTGYEPINIGKFNWLAAQLVSWWYNYYPMSMAQMRKLS